MTQERYLHFSNIDMEQPDISSECSRRGQEFKAEPNPGERVDDVLLRVRASSKRPRAQFQSEVYDLGTMKPLDLPTKRPRGNPNWGKPFQPANVLLTEFEAQASRLGLTKAEYVASAELKRWCNLNRNRVYVPEWLLAEWQMQVETNSYIA